MYAKGKYVPHKGIFRTPKLVTGGPHADHADSADLTAEEILSSRGPAQTFYQSEE